MTAPQEEAARLLAACDEKLAKYRAALEAGVDPETVGEWIAAVKAERSAFAARIASSSASDALDRPLGEEEIAAMVSALRDMRAVIQDAAAPAKAKVYNDLGLRLTYEPGKQTVRAQVILGPDACGAMGAIGVRGPFEPLRPNNVLVYADDLSLS